MALGLMGVEQILIVVLVVLMKYAIKVESVYACMRSAMAHVVLRVKFVFQAHVVLQTHVRSSALSVERGRMDAAVRSTANHVVVTSLAYLVPVKTSGSGGFRIRVVLS